MKLIQKMIKAVSGGDCHFQLQCCLKEAKRRGLTVDREKVARQIAGGLRAPKRV